MPRNRVVTEEGNAMSELFSVSGIVRGIRRLPFIQLSIGVVLCVCGAAFAGTSENIQLAQSPYADQLRRQLERQLRDAAKGGSQKPPAQDTSSQPRAASSEKI